MKGKAIRDVQGKLIAQRVLGEQDEELFEAATAGDLEWVCILLDNGADVCAETEEGWTPLIRASAAGHARCVDLLIDAGAHPDPSEISHSALRAAALYGHAAVVERLLAANANPNLPSAGMRTPLMGACFARTTEPGYSRAGTLAVAASLLRAGAEVDARNDFGETALVLAATRSDAEMAELLLAHGADTTLPMPDGRIAADVAAAAGASRLAARLRTIVRPRRRTVRCRYA